MKINISFHGSAPLNELLAGRWLSCCPSCRPGEVEGAEGAEASDKKEYKFSTASATLTQHL